MMLSVMQKAGECCEQDQVRDKRAATTNGDYVIREIDIVKRNNGEGTSRR